MDAQDERFYDAQDGVDAAEHGRASSSSSDLINGGGGVAGQDQVQRTTQPASSSRSKRVSSLPAASASGPSSGVFAQLQAQLELNAAAASANSAATTQQRQQQQQQYAQQTAAAGSSSTRPLPFPGSSSSEPRTATASSSLTPNPNSISNLAATLGQSIPQQPARNGQTLPMPPAGASAELASPVPQRRIAIPEHQQHQQGVNGAASSQGQLQRPNSFFGALDNAATPSIDQARLQPGQAQRQGFPNAHDSRGPSPTSSYVAQPRSAASSSAGSSLPRPNSFFGAPDATADDREARPSRSYVQPQLNRNSQQRSLPTPPPSSAQHSALPPGAAAASPATQAISPRSGMPSLPTLRTQSQPSQPRYSHVSQYQQHAQHASTSSYSASTYHQHPQQRQPSGQYAVDQSQPQRSSFYGLDGHVAESHSQSPIDMQGSNFRSSRSDRAASPSSRHMSTSLPRSDTGHYTASSLSSDAYAQQQYQQRRSRLPSASWSNSNPSSVYGLNAISAQMNGDQQQQQAPVLSQAHLRPGDKVSLLSHQKTLELYRQNVKKTNDPEITYELATFMLNLAREMGAQEQVAAGSNQASEENLFVSSAGAIDHSASPSPDPSMSFHSRSSGSSGDLAAGLSAMVNGRKRSSHSPASGSAQSHGGGQQQGRNGTSSPTTAAIMDRKALIGEAMALLKRNADRGHNPSQYFLADCYAQGNAKRNSGPPSGTNVIIGAIAEKGGSAAGKADFDKALPLYISAAKHGHSPSCYKAGQCLENGWGCRKDAGKAVQFYTKAAAQSYPLAMYRLGMAELNGELGLSHRKKEGFKWLKRVAELAESSNFDSEELADDPNSPGSGAAARQCAVQALHELALLHERGIDNVVFVDNEYAAELLARASELGYAPSAYKLGECYEYGRMGCPQDSALSIHYYNIAAQQNHREACFALTAWYLVGSPGILPQSDTEAYLWAKKAAEQGLSKAEYAIGYFTEVGIGTHRDEREALQWFRRAAEHGDKRAIARLRTLTNGAESYPSPPTSPVSAKGNGARTSMLHPSANGAGKKSRRATLLGMTNGNNAAASPQQNGQPAGGKNGKKADGDCIIA